MMVGSAWPAIIPTLLPMRSIFLMMSYCRVLKGEKSVDMVVSGCKKEVEIRNRYFKTDRYNK